MAGSDPKKMRAAAASDRRNFDAEEDPLVELARIVSEDSGFSAPRNERPRAVHREERIDRNAFSADLEAELLQELESSFATRAAPAPTTSSRSAPQPSRSAPIQTAPAADTNDPADDADDLLRSIEEQLGQFERSVQLDVSPEPERNQPVYAAVAAEPEPVEAMNLDEPFDTWSEEAAHKFDDQRDYRFRGPAGTGRARDHAEIDGDERYSDQAESRFVEEQPEAAGTQGYADFETAQSHDRAQLENEPHGGQREWRATAAEAARERRASQLHHDEPREDIDLSGIEAGLSRELESDYGDPTYAADSGEWDRPADRASEDARLAVTTLPERGAGRARSSRSWGRSLMLTAASVIAVVLVAGAAAYLQADDDGASGPPPLITAEEGEVKIQPPQTTEAAAEPETAGEAVYDRVAGNAPATDGEIVDSAEEPREIARIILPPSQTPDTGEGVRQIDPNAAPDPGDATAAEAPAEDEIGPRRVPTYVIRPDGTIVTTAEAGVSETTTPAPPVDIAAQTEAIEPISVPTTSIGPDGASSPGAPPAAEAADPVPAPEPTPPATAEAPASAAPQAVAEGAPTAAMEIGGVVPVEPVQPVAPAPDQPVNLLGETAAVDPAPAAAPPPTASAGYLVQISSQRSEAAAQSSFNDMQGRFASVLGSLSPDIQRADLGDRGIYFRVRVGPWASRAEAIEVCEALKAAGGDCIVTQ